MRHLKLPALILTIILLLCGCQSAASDDKPVFEPTDELIIYIPPYSDYWLKPIINKYEAMYDIEVTTVDLSDSYETYKERVNAELMASEGTDIIFPQFMLMNVQKTMENEIFMDLQPYFDNDEDFAEDDYLIKAFESGKYNGKLYIAPISFTFPAYTSSEQKLNELGFEWSSAQDTASFINQISQLTSKAQENKSFKQMLNSKNRRHRLIAQSGIEFIDYKEKQVCNDEASIKALFESLKNYFPIDYNPDGIIRGDNIGYKHLLDNEYYFDDSISADDHVAVASVLKTNGGYVIEALRGMDGLIHAQIQNSAAVRANSKNKMNAYNFIKLLLSEDIQSTYRLVGMPVHKKALGLTAYRGQITYTTGRNLGDFITTQLEKEEIEDLIVLFCSADKYHHYDITIEEIISETMLPYFQDKQDYDTCFSELKSKLNLYLYE